MNCNHLVILDSTWHLATLKDTIAEACVVADDVDIDINYQPIKGCHKKNYSFG